MAHSFLYEAIVRLRVGSFIEAYQPVGVSTIAASLPSLGLVEIEIALLQLLQIGEIELNLSSNNWSSVNNSDDYDIFLP